MSHELKKQVEVIAAPWASSPYYDDAERWTHIFWSANSPFYQYFSKLNCQTVVELACGHGRHSELVAQRADKLYLLDVVADNIDFCRTRLARFQNIEYHINNGFNFEPIDANSVTAIFCYDAMVHFSPDVAASYLKDTARILKSGGMALYHHSNYAGPAKEHYGMHPHARNCMTMPLFAQYAQQAGLQLVQSQSLSWGGINDLDGLTLLRKQ
jgi:SAM-dependent methyltransferase